MIYREWKPDPLATHSSCWHPNIYRMQNARRATLFGLARLTFFADNECGHCEQTGFLLLRGDQAPVYLREAFFVTLSPMPFTPFAPFRSHPVASHSGVLPRRHRRLQTCQVNTRPLSPALSSPAVALALLEQNESVLTCQIDSICLTVIKVNKIGLFDFGFLETKIT